LLKGFNFADIIEKRTVMPIADCDVRDPRMKRTRRLLQNALRGLLEEKTLDAIGVQDITEAATVNRATFYDHYTDKFAVFNAMVASDFHALLQERNVHFDGSCSSGLAAIILAVCDYLGRHSNQTDCAQQSSFAPLMDSAITRAIQHVVLDGLSKHAGAAVPREVAASAISWAIYGAAKEWFSSEKRQPDEASVAALVRLVVPLIQACTAGGEGAPMPASGRKSGVGRRSR
jgi:AcrR family transcriptional regulator